MYIAILGRQPVLGIAELERVFDGKNVTPLSNLAAVINTEFFDIQRLGGTLKAGKIIIEPASSDWHDLSKKIIQYYSTDWSSYTGKITLGLSAYGFDTSPRDVQKIGIILKQKLKSTGASLRLIPNQELTLSTATSHHNKLGLSPNKVELLIIRADNGRIIVAESTGAQNITAYANRDQARPRRDAFVGMLPPKLAQIMINLTHPDASARILDPFCGTGVILQEAALRGLGIYGTDLSNKMVSYSRDNLKWLSDTYHIKISSSFHDDDAMTAKWQQPIDAVVTEAYLGQPFSAPPSPSKLDEVRRNCNHILTEFLKNLSPQIASGTPVCIAIPAWRDKGDNFTHLPLIETVGQLGYKRHEFRHISQNDLLYFRPDQIVARELLVLVRS
jgi:tRNA (guanine10-N2)-dimethyltransferase